MNDLNRKVRVDCSSRIATGFKELDELLGGLKPGSLNILAAHTSVGKSALALNISTNIGTLSTQT